MYSRFFQIFLDVVDGLLEFPERDVDAVVIEVVVRVFSEPVSAGVRSDQDRIWLRVLKTGEYIEYIMDYRLYM